jgi:hypothetical protein
VLKHSAKPDNRVVPDSGSINENLTEELPQLITNMASTLVGVEADCCFDIVS